MIADLLRQKLIAEEQALIENMADGHVQDYSHYRQLVGSIAAFAQARRMLAEVEKALASPEDNDEDDSATG